MLKYLEFMYKRTCEEERTYLDSRNELMILGVTLKLSLVLYEMACQL